MGVVVLGLARECVLERFRAWTRQPLRAPTPTPSPPRRGRLHGPGGGRRPGHPPARGRAAGARGP
ncbi:hypothetical protein ABZ742_36670, partial [Streptomyces albogriseolus]|uniref:hypothetical protein n=1 Tax=Streptomyces albogriseolus TaxID=1887 RepID=UPI00345F6870